jgi:hypothetical protein
MMKVNTKEGFAGPEQKSARTDPAMFIDIPGADEVIVEPSWKKGA